MSQKKESNNQANLDVSQLPNKLKELGEQLRNLRFRVTQQDLKDVRQIRKVRKEIARLKTVLFKAVNKK